MELSYTVKILAVYPGSVDYDCTEETIAPSGISTMANPGNLPERAGELLRDGWEPISGGYAYPTADSPALTQLAFRKQLTPV